MTVFQMLQTLGRPVAYGYHSTEQELPYFCIVGNGQDQFQADNTYYVTKDRTQIEYYFKKKDPELEAEIEALLLANGFRYDKTEDIYVEDQDVFLIYYDI